MLILRRRLHLHHWQGMMLIAVGAFVVGLSSVLHPDDSDAPPPHRQHRHRRPDYHDYEGHHDSPDYEHDDYAYEHRYDDYFADSAGDHSASAVAVSVLGSLLNGAFQRNASSASSSWPGAPGRSLQSAAASATEALAAPFRSSHSRRSGSAGGGRSNPLLGNLFVMTAQIFSALQFVVEEKYVKHYRMPALLAVGLEGFWGLILSCGYLPLFLHMKVRFAALQRPRNGFKAARTTVAWLCGCCCCQAGLLAGSLHAATHTLLACCTAQR